MIRNKRRAVKLVFLNILNGGERYAFPHPTALFTYANRLSAAVVAVVVEPARVRSEEAPVVCGDGAVLLTRPKDEGRCKS